MRIAWCSCSHRTIWFRNLCLTKARLHFKVQLMSGRWTRNKAVEASGKECGGFNDVFKCFHPRRGGLKHVGNALNHAGKLNQARKSTARQFFWEVDHPLSAGGLAQAPFSDAEKVWNVYG